MRKPTPSLPTFHKIAAELKEASAAFRVDALHSRLTGATVVLEGNAPDGLADLLDEAALVIDALLSAVGDPTTPKTEA